MKAVGDTVMVGEVIGRLEESGKASTKAAASAAGAVGKAEFRQSRQRGQPRAAAAVRDRAGAVAAGRESGPGQLPAK